MTFEFKKGEVTKTEKITLPDGRVYKKPIEYKDRGYFFKGEFLHVYKNEAIDILRKRVEEAGKKESEKLSPMNPNYQIPFQIGKEILKDEAQIVIQQQEEMNQRTKKTEETKKPYYEQQRVEAKLKKIERLQKELDQLKGKNIENQSDSNKGDNSDRDKFEISDGNLKVLTLIPEMMKHPAYRKQLRRLAFEFLQDTTWKNYRNRWFI
jgi:hypothetical protein